MEASMEDWTDDEADGEGHGDTEADAFLSPPPDTPPTTLPVYTTIHRYHIRHLQGGERGDVFTRMSIEADVSAVFGD